MRPNEIGKKAEDTGITQRLHLSVLNACRSVSVIHRLPGSQLLRRLQTRDRLLLDGGV